MSSASKSRRRWFQFSLTSLFVMITLVAVWLAWELPFIRERQAWVASHPALVDPGSRPGKILTVTVEGDLNLVATHTLTKAGSPTKPRQPATIPWWRRIMGDAPVTRILDIGFDDDDRALAARLFPESVIEDPLPGLVGSVTGPITYGLEDADPAAVAPASSGQPTAAPPIRVYIGDPRPYPAA
jgi:hypothetical protein